MTTHRTRMQPFISFAVNPEGVRFETQEESETVVLFLRQHFIVNIPWIILATLMIIAPSVIIPFIIHTARITWTVPVGYIIVATVWWYVATFGFILAKFLGWFINIYIVTNERIVDIDFYNLLSKHFSQAELNRIQDITFTTKGILAAMFNFGDVIIQTAGEQPNLTFEKVPKPDQVVEIIRNLTGKRGKHP